jgi:hypothetical protein
MSRLRFVTGYKKEEKIYPILQSMTIQSASLCQGTISNWFIIQALNAADIIILAYASDTDLFLDPPKRYQERKAIDVKGVALIQTYSTYLYLDLLCASGAGKALLDQIVDMAKIQKKKTIRLASTPVSMSYWLNQGFQNMKGSEDKCVMTDKLHQAAQSVLPLKFSTWEEAVENETLKKYMTLLTDMRYTKQRGCKGEECYIDGYTMTLCVDRYGKEKQISNLNPNPKRKIPVKSRSNPKRKTPAKSRPEPKRKTPVNSRTKTPVTSRSKTLVKSKSTPKKNTPVKSKPKRQSRYETRSHVLRRSKRQKRPPTRLMF